MLMFDITEQNDFSALCRMLQHPLLKFVHLAPPPDTCSRAREKALRGVRGGGPPLLRSDDFPLGFPDLAERLPSFVARVHSANQVYQACINIATDMLSLDVAFSLENPEDSLFWQIPFVSELVQE